MISLTKKLPSRQIQSYFICSTQCGSSAQWHLPLGVWRLITPHLPLAFCESITCDTHKVLIRGYIYPDQLKTDDWERQQGDRKRGEKYILLQSFLTFHPHIWHSLKHTHIQYTQWQTHTCTLSVFSSLPVCYVGQCESFTWAHVQTQHYLLHYSTVQPLALNTALSWH